MHSFAALVNLYWCIDETISLNYLLESFHWKNKHCNWVTSRHHTANGFFSCSTHNSYNSHFPFCCKERKKSKINNGNYSAFFRWKQQNWIYELFLRVHSIYQVINIEHKPRDLIQFNWHSIKINNRCFVVNVRAIFRVRFIFFSRFVLLRFSQQFIVKWSKSQMVCVKCIISVCQGYPLFARNLYHSNKYT